MVCIAEQEGSTEYTETDFCRYLFERGLPEQSKSYFQVALDICDHAADKESEKVQAIIRQNLNFLGCAAAETNDRPSCLKYQLRALEMAIARTHVDGSQARDYEIGIAHNEMGVAYAMNDMFDEAVGHFISSIQIFQTVDGYEDIWLGWPEPNLGIVYYLQGKLTEAERVLEEILDIYAAAYGPDDTNTFK
jgi:tetratricopeptide (TPR) repeat protein